MPPGRVSEGEIRDWCIAYLRRTVDAPAAAVDIDASFAAMGIDSASSAYFIVELEEWLGIELEPELVFDHPTIADLARHIMTRPGFGNAAG